MWKICSNDDFSFVVVLESVLLSVPDPAEEEDGDRDIDSDDDESDAFAIVGNSSLSVSVCAAVLLKKSICRASSRSGLMAESSSTFPR